MFDTLKGLASRAMTRTKTVAVAAIAAVTVSASAQTDPPLGDIVWPIDLASIGTAVGAAGGTMLGIWAIYAIGFKLVRKLISRMGRVV